MSPDMPSQGRLGFNGHYTNADSGRQRAPSVSSVAVHAESAMPEVKHGLERVDRESRAGKIIGSLKLSSPEAKQKVASSLFSLEDTFFVSVEHLMGAVPYANEVDSSRRLIASLLGSNNRGDLIKRLGASTVMYGRKDHKEMLWLLQGLRAILPDENAPDATADMTFRVADDDD